MQNGNIATPNLMSGRRIIGTLIPGELDASVDPNFRVWLDGIEVTTGCLSARGSPRENHPALGTVTVLRLNGEGKPYVDRMTGKLAKTTLSGVVRWMRKSTGRR